MSTAEKPEFVLFLSKNCKFCKNFLDKLKPKPELFKKFNIVDIDTLKVIPDEVDEIPCVYDGKGLFKGADAFKWLNEKMSDFLDAANDGLAYSFVDNQEELVFNNYSLLDQKNGSFGMDGTAPSQQNSQLPSGSDPTRMLQMNDNTNKNRTLDSLMASRTSEVQVFNGSSSKNGPSLNK